MPTLKQCIPNDFGATWVTSKDQARRGQHVPLAYIDICDGDDVSAKIFSQIMYWHTPSVDEMSGATTMRLQIQRDGHYWLAKAYGEWFKETRIRHATAKRSVKHLCELKLIESKLYDYGGVPEVPHVRVNWTEFERRIRLWMQLQDSLQAEGKVLDEKGYRDYLAKFSQPTPDQIDSPPMQNDPPPSHSDSPPDQNDPQYRIPIDFPEIPQKWKRIDDEAMGEIRLLIHGARFHGKKHLGKYSYIWDKLIPPVAADPLAYMSQWAKVDSHPLWLAFRQHYPTGEKLTARNTPDLWQDLTLLDEIGATADEIQQVLKWRITPKRRSVYKFKYLLDDVRELREKTVLPPPVIDPALEVAICKTFHMQPGDFVTRIAQFLSGQDGDHPTWNQYKLRQPMTARELAAFKGWYDADERFENQETPPKTAPNLRDRLDEFRGSPNHAAYVERAEHRLNQWLGVKPPTAVAPPASDDPPPDLEFAARFEADMAALAVLFDGRR